MQTASMPPYVHKLHAGLIKVSTLFPWGRDRISGCIVNTLTSMLLLCRRDCVARLSQPQRQPPSREIIEEIWPNVGRFKI